METNKDISKLISFLKDNAEDGFTKEDFIAAKSSIETENLLKEKLLKDKKTNADLVMALDAYIQKKYDTQLPSNVINTIFSGLDKGIKTIIAGTSHESASKSDPLSKEAKSTFSVTPASFNSFNDFVEYIFNEHKE